MPYRFLYLSDEMWIDVPFRAVVPRNHQRAHGMPDKQKFHFASAIYEHRRRFFLEKIGSLLRGEVVHYESSRRLYFQL